MGEEKGSGIFSFIVSPSTTAASETTGTVDGTLAPKAFFLEEWGQRPSGCYLHIGEMCRSEKGLRR